MGYLGYFSAIGLALVAVSLLAGAIAAGLRAARPAAPAPVLPDNVIPFPHPDLAQREQLTAAQAFDEAIAAARPRSDEFHSPGILKGRSYDD